MKSRTVCALLAAISVCAAPATAQEDDDGEDRDDDDTRVALTVGVQTVDVAALNGRLEARGRPTFGEEHALFGATVALPVGPAVLEAEAEGLGSGERTTPELEQSLSAGRFWVNAGWPIRLGGRGSARLRPYGGVGAATLTLESVQHGPVDFDEALEEGGPGTRLENREALFQAGVALTVPLGDWSLGARAGWAFAPFEGDWTADETTVLSGPDVGLGGFFLKGSFGI